jgi:hypothetical protein
MRIEGFLFSDAITGKGNGPCGYRMSEKNIMFLAETLLKL